VRKIDKNGRKNGKKVGEKWSASALDKQPQVLYDISITNQHFKCDDEESRTQANSQASRGWCKPGESSGAPKITSELQPELQ
jgi:hypothetical protein